MGGIIKAEISGIETIFTDGFNPIRGVNETSPNEVKVISVKINEREGKKLISMIKRGAFPSPAGLSIIQDFVTVIEESLKKEVRNVEFDTSTIEGDEEVNLTLTEYNLLKTLMIKAGIESVKMTKTIIVKDM